MKKFWIPFLALLAVFGIIDKVILPIYTSSGKEILVPDVRNRTYDEAVSMLKHSGLQVARSYNSRWLANVAPDMVIDQEPAAGSPVKPGRNVYLVLNRQDKPSYVMPELAGRSETEARQVLARFGMVVGEIQFRPVSNHEEDGRVLSQSVPPNVSVLTGTAVSLIVGKYEVEPQEMKRVVVPEVLGMSLDQARSTVLQRGLRIGRITYEYSAILVPNTVISQKPGANSFASESAPVDMTVVTGERN